MLEEEHLRELAGIIDNSIAERCQEIPQYLLFVFAQDSGSYITNGSFQVNIEHVRSFLKQYDLAIENYVRHGVNAVNVTMN